MNRYCLVNINGLKSKPVCKTELVLTKEEHDKGYRITKSTIGVGMSIATRNIRCRFFNTYTFDRYQITFGWVASILPDNRIVGSVFNGNITMELRLESINLIRNGRAINGQLPCNIITDLIAQINAKLPYQVSDIKYVELDMIMMLFASRYHKLFEYLVGLIENGHTEFTVTEKRAMRPTDISLKMEIFR